MCGDSSVRGPRSDGLGAVSEVHTSSSETSDSLAATPVGSDRLTSVSLGTSSILVQPTSYNGSLTLQFALAAKWVGETAAGLEGTSQRVTVL